LARATYVFIGRRLDWFSRSLSNDQALLTGGILLVVAVITFLIGLLADRVGGNRRMLEELLYRTRRAELDDIAWRRAMEQRIDQMEALDETGLIVPRGHSDVPPATDD
jgi:hypothetical protein